MEQRSNALIDRWISLALFLASAGLYVHSAGPGLPAYRDAGEMVVALGTLGVAHPPGYPLYVLAGSLAARLPLGCIALRAEYFSALCGAGAVALFFLFLNRLAGRGPAVVISALLAVSNPFWELSAVPEMYSLGALFLVAVLYAALVMENAALAGFLFGLSLGVRMDTLLIAPALAWPFVRRRRELALAALFATAGASVFLYLPLRSLRQPWLDWGDPETLDRFLAAVTRRSYGSGLDLLSASYRRGENFFDGLSLFARHLFANGGPLMLAASTAGLVIGRRLRGRAWATAVAGLTLSGPIFLFMANLPLNPHAVAIMQAAFLTPMIFIAVAAALGVALLRGRWRPAALAALAMTVGVNGAHASVIAVRRAAWAERDYVEAVLRSAPRNAIVILHEDVQLFGMWEAQAIEGRRPDLRVLATGLAGSPWYWAMAERWPGGDVPAAPLTNDAGFRQFLALGRPVAAGFETDVPPSIAAGMTTSGLLRAAGGPPVDADRLAQVTAQRIPGARAAADFFSLDLLSDVARALHDAGVSVLKTNAPLAERLFRRSAAQDPDFPAALADRGYVRFMAGDIEGARALYDDAAENFTRLLADTVVYRSLPDAVEPIRDGLTGALGQEGVSLERLGRPQEARAAYERSLQVKPTSQANYNLGVMDWGHDWASAASHMTKAAALDPANPQMRAYAQAAQRHAAGEK